VSTDLKVAIITGASQGIGEGLVRGYLARGYRVVANSRSIRPDAYEGDVLAIAGDITDPAVAERVVGGAVARFGRVDTLVNNAGVSMWARFDELRDLRALEQVMRVNYFGAVYCTRYALPYLKATRGRIVAVSSLAGRAGVPTRSGYAASKHAMAGFFDSLRVELMGSGVAVTMIYPGFVSTGIRENATGPDGKPILVSPVKEGEVMRVEECAARIVRAIERRERKVVMTARGKMGLWLRLVAPGLVDRIARHAVERGR